MTIHNAIGQVGLSGSNYEVTYELTNVHFHWGWNEYQGEKQ